MNNTRIVIPIVCPEPSRPRFDDEATLVTARRVVPIRRAKAIERSQITLLVLSGVVGAGAFGAIGGIGVKYYQDRSPGPAPPLVRSVSTEQQAYALPESSPQSPAPTISASDPSSNSATSVAESRSAKPASSPLPSEASAADVQAKSPEAVKAKAANARSFVGPSNRREFGSPTAADRQTSAEASGLVS